MNKDHTSHETKNAARRVKLLVVEDSFIVRQRLGALIERIASVDLVGSAEDGTQGLEMFRALQPEAVALDLQLPGLNGFDLLALIKRERPDCLVMVLTTYAEDVCREQCIRLGADYFFNKSSEFERVIEVLEAMASPVRPGAAAPGCSRRSDAHETARLHSLRQHRVLDTQPEPQFDDIARLAALVCDAPISFISLADEQRHWFKARVGIEWSEVARNHAFCDYAIEATGMFVIRDTAADERFARHPLVTAPPHARFYAGVPLRLANGHALGMLAVMDARPRELTPAQTGALQCLGRQAVALLEHRLAGEHLRKREDDYRVMIRTAHDGFWLVDAQGRLLDVNEAYCRLTGYSREQLLAMSISDVEAAESPEQVTRHIAQIMAAGSDRFETRHRCPDGRTVELEVSANYTPRDGGRLFAFFRDITEHKRAEQSLRDSEEKHRTLFESSRDAIMTLAPPDWKFTGANPATLKMFGAATEAAFVSAGPWELSPERQPDGRPSGEKAREMIGTAMREGSHYFEWTHKRHSGEEFPATVLLTRMQLAGRPLLQATVRDITGQKRAEQSSSLLATAVEQAAEAIVITDAAGAIQYVNPAFEQITGYAPAEAIGQNSRILKSGKHDDAFYKQMWTTLGRGEVWTGHFINKRKDGKLYEEEATISPVRDAAGRVVNYVAVKRDVTEHKKLEAQMLRAQRLESIGTLAGGIAHDLNNVLAPILMSVELLRMKHPEEGSQKILSTIDASAQRGAELIKQVLAFSKGIQGGRAPMQLRHVVREMQSISRQTFPKSVLVQIELPKDLWTVEGDATQLHQVLMNLCVNARDALPTGGQIVIKAENLSVDEAFARMHPEAKAQPYVVLTVTDTGTGMPPEVRERIFEPFFTTKELGRGTGLGLSTVLGIVKGHGGFMTVYSEVGRGTRFQIYLPATLSPDLERAVAGRASLPRGHGELILVVDDEAAIREIAKQTLAMLGFQVLTASNGAEAVALGVQHVQQLKLLITDVMMPIMDGPATIRALRRLRPGLKVIAASGLDSVPRVTDPGMIGADAFLRKPFTAETLARTVRQTLAEN